MNKLALASAITALAFTTACSTSSDSDDSSDGGSGSGSGTISLSGAVALPEQMTLLSAQDSTTATANSLRAIHDTSAFAADSDYSTSRQNLYVYLDAMQPISFIDSLLCFVNQSRPLLMKDEGNYISWNDAGRCFEENGSQGETQSQGGDTNQAPSYVTIVADSAQASATDPLIFRGWVEDYAGQSGEGGGPDAIKLRGEVRQTPTDDNPFGEFTLTYGLLPTINGAESTSTGKGEVISNETTGGGASFTLYQEDEITENFGQGELTVNCTTQASVDYNEATETGLARTGNDCTVSGGGDLPDFVDTQAFALAVNPDYVHMATASSFDNLAAETYEADVCLARDDFNEVAWSYTLFNKADGSEVSINSGLQLQVDSNGDGSGTDSDGFESWGHIGYWGSWREDGQQFENGETVQEATYDGSTGDSYTVKVAPGRLIKNTIESLNLSDLDGVTFSTWMFEGDTYLLSSATDFNGDSDTNDGFEVLLEANSSNDGFEVVGTREWTENGPTVNDINPAVAVPLNTNAVLHMWSNQLGGDIRYLAGASKIRFFSRSFVNGGETGTGELFDGTTSVTLKCFERCLDVNVAASDVSGAANQEDVFVSNSFGQAQDYSFAQADLTLKIGADSVTFASTVTSSDLQQSQNWQWGLHSGAMITSTVATANSITTVGGMFQAIESGTITEFYVWETGLEPWQQQTILINSSDAVVSFDRPVTIKYTHETANDRNGNSGQNGQVYLLEYGGAGQLWGFPWSQDGENWYPQVSLKDAVIMGSSDQYIIKANEVEQKMAVVADSNCTDLPLTAPSQAVPTAVTGAVFDIGEMPTLTDETPSVIDGEPVE